MTERMETHEILGKRRWLRRLVRWSIYLTVVVMLGAIAGVVAGFLVYEEVTRPGVPGPQVEFEVPRGATAAEVGELLATRRLLAHPLLFRVAIRLDESGEPLKHGPYHLHHGMSPSEILVRLQEGPNRSLRPEDIPDELKVTIPEGLRLTQIADLFEDPDAFLAAAMSEELLARIGTGRPTPEGFLLPNTYFFDSPPTAEAIVERMAKAFEDVYVDLLEEHPEAADRSPLEIVTIASLVEEEARTDEERPVIAAVIYNRLERNRPLDFDSTLQYALNKYGQRLLNEDKEVDSPFNTYRNRGLPPGPISNPGEASLRAAMAPADVEYLYFVSNADGKTHTFSETLQEHNRAVARYRAEIRKQRQALEE